MKRITILFAAMSLSAETSFMDKFLGFVAEIMEEDQVTMDMPYQEGKWDSLMMLTLVMELEAEYGVTPWLGVSLGAIYSQQGAKFEASLGQLGVNEEGRKVAVIIGLKGKLKADYINMPLLANFYVWKGLSVKTGLQVGFLVNDKMSGNGAVAGFTEIPADQLIQEDLSISSATSTSLSTFSFEESDICKSVVFGIPVGLSYEYKNITLDARYYFGLTRMDDVEDDAPARNRCLSITLGYKFKL